MQLLEHMRLAMIENRPVYERMRAPRPAMVVDRTVYERMRARPDARVEIGPDGKFVTTGGRTYRQAALTDTD